jgi:putative FmdB family regulatory protein
VPLYEYQCQKCRHRFEKIQKFSDAPVKKCPECGGKVEKMLSAPAFHFKGSGFYKTDYPSQSSGGGEPKSGTSDDGKSSDVESSATKVEKSASDTKNTKTSESKTAEPKPAKSKSESSEKKSQKK